MSAKLGEILVRENLISPQHLRQALDYQREHGGRLGFNLVKLGLVSDDTITAILSRQYGIPSVNLELFDIEDSVSASFRRKSRKNIRYCHCRVWAQRSHWRWSIRQMSLPWTTSSS
jgi:hypothetical protein